MFNNLKNGMQQVAPAPSLQTRRPNQTGSGFVNLQKIVGANQNNKLGSAIKTGINNQVGQVNNSIQNATNTFNEHKDANTFNNPQVQAKVQSTIDNPLNITDDTVKEFEKFRKGVYEGPKGLQDVDTLKHQAIDAQQLGQQAGQSGGRANLLQRFVGGNQYTSGLQRLDNLILGQTGAKDLHEVTNQTKGLTDKVYNSQLSADHQAKQAALANKKFAGDLTTKLDTAYKQAEQPVMNRVKTDPRALEEAERQKIYNEMMAVINKPYDPNSGITEATHKDLIAQELFKGERFQNYLGNALDPAASAYRQVLDAENAMWNPTFKQFGHLNEGPIDTLKNSINYKQGNISAMSLADEQEVAKLNALKKLAGKNDFLTKEQYNAGNLGFHDNMLTSAARNAEDQALMTIFGNLAGRDAYGNYGDTYGPGMLPNAQWMFDKSGQLYKGGEINNQSRLYKMFEQQVIGELNQQGKPANQADIAALTKQRLLHPNVVQFYNRIQGIPAPVQGGVYADIQKPALSTGPSGPLITGGAGKYS